MAKKTYKSLGLHLSITRFLNEERTKKADIFFETLPGKAYGELSTSDVDEQKFIEASELFRTGRIWLKSREEEAAEAEAKNKAERAAAPVRAEYEAKQKKDSARREAEEKAASAAAAEAAKSSAKSKAEADAHKSGATARANAAAEEDKPEEAKA